MKPLDLLGELICAPLIWALETFGRIANRRILAAATNPDDPDDPDESDAAAASPVADYRSNA